MSESTPGRLRRLAQLYNVQAAYYDVNHRRQPASTDSLVAVLRALGAPLASTKEIIPAIRERRQELWQRVLEPVTVVRGEEHPLIKLRLPAKLAGKPADIRLEMESGESRTFRYNLNDAEPVESAEIEGTEYLVKPVVLPAVLPRGYHKLILEAGGENWDTLIIVAPEKAFPAPEDNAWGVFLPLYSLRTQNATGNGDYKALGDIADWIAPSGGRVVATLPLLPFFLDEPFEPSPYAPVSRLLWNEFYINLESVPELTESYQARDLLQSSTFQSEVAKLRDLPMVDYRRLMALKRRVLEECSRHLIATGSERWHEFRTFIDSNPVVADYARFRAVMEKLRSPWPSWPSGLRDGTVRESDYEENNKLYHMYAQWLAHLQIQNLAERARRRGVNLNFDLPTGTHPSGYDTWRERESFALEATAGAPPDTVFTQGQNWGFPPLHPERIREQGYRHFRSYIRHHLKNAGMLRIDHVMGLHRLFWIPRGMDAGQGVYVRYRAEEFYAVLSLESHRHRSVIVGEDLGTVPAYVRPAMSRHGLQRMYILHYELAGDSSKLNRPGRNAVASLNTHDMPPFASFWQGLDIPEKQAMGLLGDKDARDERRARRRVKKALSTFLKSQGWLDKPDADVSAVFKACLSFLSSSPARLVLVNLEDLWRETQSQNVPGTDGSNLNWRRQARYTFEEFRHLPEVQDTLKEIDRLRKRVRK